MAPVRGKRGVRRSTTSNTTNKWMFLQPWVDALRQSSIRNLPGPLPPPSIEVTFRCWTGDISTEQQHTRKCHIVVGFAAEAASRKSPQRLQRLREAMELFNVLATVDGTAFTSLLAPFIVDNDEWIASNGYPIVKILPVWTCQLMGKLPRTDPATTTSPITWDALFGCSDDPWEYSAEFRAAALKLEAMDGGSRDASKALMFSTKWKTFHGGIPMTAWNKEPNDAWGGSVPKTMEETITRPRADHFVREMKSRWKGVVPILAQVAAVRYGMDVFEAWGRSKKPFENFSNAVTGTPHFESPYVMESGIVFSCSGIIDLTLSLDDRSVGRTQWGTALQHEGFLFSILVSGQALHSAPLPRKGTYPFLKLIYSWASNRTIAAVVSALTEAHKVESLSIKPSEEDDTDIQPVNPIRWQWVAFALFSNASNATLNHVELTKLRVTKRDVAAVAAVMKSGYPQPVVERSGVDNFSKYGYVDVQQGTQLHFVGLPDDTNATFTLVRDCRCRALNDPTTTGTYVHVVVPGYGICKLEPGKNGVNEFIPDPPSGPPIRADRSQGVQYLQTFFLRPESGAALTDMLALIGKDLRGIMIAETPDVPITLELGAVAVACPNLKQLHASCFSVAALDHEGLRGWGVTSIKLLLHSEVRGLAEALNAQVFQKLVDLEVIVTAYANPNRKYVRELEAHNGEYVPVIKRKFPLRSKAAVLSVMKCSKDAKHVDNDKLDAASRVDKKCLGLIFEMAATPSLRSVRVSSGELDATAA